MGGVRVGKWEIARPDLASIALRLSFGAGFPWDSLLFFFADEKVLFVYASRHRDVEESHHHFVIGLFAPAPLAIRIRIVQVRLGIVVPRAPLKSCSRFQVSRH